MNLENKKHRVRFFLDAMHYKETYDKQPQDIFWLVANKFKETKQARWVEDNDIELKWLEDDGVKNWHKVCVIYSDLTEEQYVSYSLRFFKHNEDWK
jgi:hypothetical protein